MDNAEPESWVLLDLVQSEVWTTAPEKADIIGWLVSISSVWHGGKFNIIQLHSATTVSWDKAGNLQSFIVESQSWNYIFISDVMYRSTKPASQKMSHCSNTCRQWCVLTYLRTVRYYIEVTMNVYWRRCLNNFCFYFQVQKWTLDEF